MPLTLNIRIINCPVVVALHQYATKSAADVGDLSEIAGANQVVSLPVSAACYAGKRLGV